MESLFNVLEGFSPEQYLSTLVKVAHLDGLHPSEEALLNQQAINLGIDLNSLPDVPDDLSKLPWATRILVYRDAFMLAQADGIISAKEQVYLSELAGRLQLREEIVNDIVAWTEDYSHLLTRLEKLTQISN